MRTDTPRSSAILAGLALIVLPIAAVVLKLSVFPGWMIVIAIWGSPMLLIGYALQVVIAGHGLLRARGIFRRSRAGFRGVVAALATSLGVLGAAFFLIDGGDDGTYGSAFTELLGMSSTSQGSETSMVLFFVCAFAWLAGWLWLVVEWVAQLILARRAFVEAREAPHPAPGKG